MTKKANVLICGGGVIGLTLARELLKNDFKDIVVLEKEENIGEHASGRNSGVLHAGVYYAPDSLKARFCHKGNILMREYCRDKNIPVLESGKVIVSRSEEEVPLLQQLYQRAIKNGAKVEMVEEEKLKSIEPYAKTCQKALFSPDTSVVNPKEVLENLKTDLVASGTVEILNGVEFIGLKNNGTVITNNGSIDFGLFVNAAGSYSDKVAHMFGVGTQYKVVPFKGTYKRLIKEKNHLVKGNIYPVPDIRTPFLGVHFTRSMDGTVHVGPTAIPALGRENYRIFDAIDSEICRILYRNMGLLFNSKEFREIALAESKKYSSKFFFESIKDMVEGISLKDIEPSSKVGIRPQLVDWDKKELVMDFLVLESDRSVHILNTISPGFTCSMAFAEYIVEKYMS